MPAIKKEVVFGLLILLLLVMFVLNMMKKGHSGLKFGDVLGEAGVTILVDSNRKAIDSSITFKTPTGAPVIGGVQSKIYKFPLLYLIDPTGVANTNAATIDGDAKYDKPPPTALINSANKASNAAWDVTVYGTGSAGSTSYYNVTTAPITGKYYPNILNLVNLYSATPGISAPSTGAFVLTGDSIALDSTGTWVLSGMKEYFNCELISGRTYVLGVALQLTDNAYVNFDGSTRALKQEPLSRRYGNFKYFDVAYSVSGLTVATPGMPTGTTSATLTLEI